MSNWKVFASAIELFPHPNADRLALGKLGDYQVVVGRNEYKSGEIIVFAPKRSILPPDLAKLYVGPNGASYLGGPEANRVRSIRLRGELSEGVVLPSDWVGDKLDSLFNEHDAWEWQLGEDISGLLGITEYFPELAVQRDGRGRGAATGWVPRESVSSFKTFYTHDVEQFRIFESYFKPDDIVTVTEEIHGSQICIARDRNGVITVSSKGASERGFVIEEILADPWWYGRKFTTRVRNLIHWLIRKAKGIKPARNVYWQAAYNSGIIGYLSNWPKDSDTEFQVFGEVIPFQEGYSYGKDHVTVLIFRVIVNGTDAGYHTYFPNWVPLIYQGKYDLNTILPLRSGDETVSGKALHIREGVVLRHEELKFTENGTPLIVKLLNPSYRDNDDDPS